MVEHIIDFLGRYLSGWLGYAIVFLACFGENSIGLGLVIPGETLVILGAVYASPEAPVPVGSQRLWLPAVTMVAIAGAVIGDNVGYWIGRRYARQILDGHAPGWLFPQKRLAKADAYYREHGGKTVFLGRFVPVVRSFGCLLAGMSKMSWRRFFLFDLAGAVLWACGHTALGYVLGTAFLRNKDRIEGYLTGGGLLILVALVLLVVGSRKAAKSRKARQGTAERTKGASDPDEGDRPSSIHG